MKRSEPQWKRRLAKKLLREEKEQVWRRLKYTSEFQTFESIIIPLIRKMVPSSMGNNIMGVQPIPPPSDSVLKLKIRKGRK